jgi:hypothetical protein
VWKSTSSKSKTLRQKFEEALLKLAEFYAIYPHLDPENTDKSSQEKYLALSYNAIIEAAKKQIGLTTDEYHIDHV